jgi:hypothetical protein
MEQATSITTFQKLKTFGKFSKTVHILVTNLTNRFSDYFN